MNIYKENNCRMCRKVFCCRNCREKHEITTHNIFLDCNICIYGKTLIRDPTECLLEHIKSQHWPLHCINCKQFFESLDELTRQSKCQIEHKNQCQKSPYTPIQSSVKYESPPYFTKEQLAANNHNMFSNLATSTPLQRGEATSTPPQRENINEAVITPVEFPDANKEKKSFTESVSLKRKVTFCETPVTESYKNQAPIEEEEFEDQAATPSLGNSVAVFYSATQNLPLHSTPPQVNENPVSRNTDPLPLIKIDEHEEENEDEDEDENEHNTLWISAINASPTDLKDESKSLAAASTTTPVLAKSKKRQVNIVVPITVENNLELPSNLHSTALSGIKYEESIPVFSQIQLKSDESDVPENNAVDPDSNTSDTNRVFADTSATAPGRFWTSVTRLVKNVSHAVQELSNVTHIKTPLKRANIEYDSVDGPYIKRYKLTEIKCRRPIRELTLVERPEYNYYSRHVGSSIMVEVTKTFVNKATQTDE